METSETACRPPTVSAFHQGSIPEEWKMNDRCAYLGGCFLKTLFRILLIITTLGISGCQAVNPLPGFGLSKTSPEEERIQKLLKWHSGRVEVYRDFRTVFTARAVYISDEVRRAVVDWEAKSRLMDPVEKEELFRKTFHGDQKAHQILLGFYTPDGELNDLDRSDSTWVVYLERSDGTIIRTACFDLGGEEGKIYMRFLRWDLSWSRLYVLCFPEDPGGGSKEDGWVKFVISGPAGQGEMRLRTGPPPP